MKRRAKGEISEWSWHEALDRAGSLDLIFHDLLAEHVVMRDKKIRKAADKVAEAIADLYQKIGTERFDRFPDPPKKKR
jgi:hypothetical protein